MFVQRAATCRAPRAPWRPHRARAPSRTGPQRGRSPSPPTRSTSCRRQRRPTDRWCISPRKVREMCVEIKRRWNRIVERRKGGWGGEKGERRRRENVKISAAGPRLLFWGYKNFVSIRRFLGGAIRIKFWFYVLFLQRALS